MLAEVCGRFHHGSLRVAIATGAPPHGEACIHVQSWPAGLGLTQQPGKRARDSIGVGLRGACPAGHTDYPTNATGFDRCVQAWTVCQTPAPPSTPACPPWPPDGPRLASPAWRPCVWPCGCPVRSGRLPDAPKDKRRGEGAVHLSGPSIRDRRGTRLCHFPEKTGIGPLTDQRGEGRAGAMPERPRRHPGRGHPQALDHGRFKAWTDVLRPWHACSSTPSA